MPGFSRDPELDRSTNRWMMVGLGLMGAMVLAFPLYRIVEPAAREEAREVQLASFESEGRQMFIQNCASCHGAQGEGVTAPALNSQQFLQSASDEQIRTIIAAGIPGTEMSAWNLSFGGPLTSEQIRSLVVFIRSWQEGAPDRPDWRNPGGVPDAEGDDAAPTGTDGAEPGGTAQAEDADAAR